MSFNCRFAPSPTGPLHIGGVRTALFNWLLAKKNKGKYFLRIEDTDKERSKEEFKKQIISSLAWLGIEHEGEEYIQSKNISKHVTVAEDLIKKGFAYACYCSEEEINEQKEKCKKQGIPYVYNRKWRDAKDLKIPKDAKPVIRFKSKISGNTIIKDLVQGERNISNSTIEDFVILRKDKSPTYQLSATVDDHEMKITHVIRGDDHMINSFKQKQIYDAMGWEVPKFAHIPLIHSEKGKKLSKRDNASTINDYIKIGIIPEALRNYLLRLGWSYKDKEIFSLKESIELFNFEGIGKSPSKLDMSRILSMNETYIKSMDEKKLFDKLLEFSNKFKMNIDRLKKLSKEHIDYFIFGHRHLPIVHQLKTKSKYINLGDWITHFTYGVFDGKTFTLRNFWFCELNKSLALNVFTHKNKIEKTKFSSWFYRIENN